jgi:hypothetical protein
VRPNWVAHSRMAWDVDRIGMEGSPDDHLLARESSANNMNLAVASSECQSPQHAASRAVSNHALRLGKEQW